MKARIVVLLSISIILLLFTFCGGGGSSSENNDQQQGPNEIWSSIPSAGSAYGNQITKTEHGVYAVAYTVFVNENESKVFVELVNQDLSILHGWPLELDSAGYCFLLKVFPDDPGYIALFYSVITDNGDGHIENDEWHIELAILSWGGEILFSESLERKGVTGDIRFHDGCFYYTACDGYVNKLIPGTWEKQSVSVYAEKLEIWRNKIIAEGPYQMYQLDSELTIEKDLVINAGVPINAFTISNDTAYLGSDEDFYTLTLIAVDLEAWSLMYRRDLDSIRCPDGYCMNRLRLFYDVMGPLIVNLDRVGYLDDEGNPDYFMDLPITDIDTMNFIDGTLYLLGHNSLYAVDISKP